MLFAHPYRSRQLEQSPHEAADHNRALLHSPAVVECLFTSINVFIGPNVTSADVIPSLCERRFNVSLARDTDTDTAPVTSQESKHKAAGSPWKPANSHELTAITGPVWLLFVSRACYHILLPCCRHPVFILSPRWEKKEFFEGTLQQILCGLMCSEAEMLF